MLNASHVNSKTGEKTSPTPFQKFLATSVTIRKGAFGGDISDVLRLLSFYRHWLLNHMVLPNRQDLHYLKVLRVEKNTARYAEKLRSRA